LDEVDLLNLSATESNAPQSDEVNVVSEESPKNVQMEEFKVEVVKEVNKMKQVLLDEFKNLAQEHLRTSVVEETIMDTIQNSTQDSAKAVIDWMERDRRSIVQAQELESATEMERLKMAYETSIADQQKKSGIIVERLKKKMADLEHALRNSNVEVETLRKHRQKDVAERLRLKAQIGKNKVDELKVAAVVQEFLPDPLFEDLDIGRVHRLNTMAGLSTNVQKACVSNFLQTYSNVTEWNTLNDPKLHTTTYIFEFDGTMWKTRISFLYPFVNYMTQVIGVNKKALGSVFVILPTSTVAFKINRLSHYFSQMLKTLLTHNSNGLWNYIFIFLKNVSTHYGSIKAYVGSRTRTIKNREDRRGQVYSPDRYALPSMRRSVTDSVLTTTTSEPMFAEQKSNRNYGHSARFLHQGERKMATSQFETRSSGRKHADYTLKAVF